MPMNRICFTCMKKNKNKNYFIPSEEGAVWTRKLKIGRNNWKVLILPRIAELLNHKEKQRGCLLLDANKHTHIYIIFICLRL